MVNSTQVLVGGEALFDFISTTVGLGLGRSLSFDKRAGGSPFNIAVGIRRLGVATSYVAKLGVDQFGDALAEFLQSESVDLSNVIREEGTKTTLAFVAVDKDAKPEFRFYRDHAADIALRIDELAGVDPELYSIFHCGGIVLAEEPSSSAYAALADRFAAHNIPVSLDPTVRKSLILDADRYLTRLREIASKVSILKVSDEELQFMTDTEDFDSAVKRLPMKKGALVFVTLGKAGSSVYRDGNKLAETPGYPVKVVETTGCGDSFMAATLSQLAGNSIAQIAALEPEKLAAVMRFSNAAAAIVATRVGAAEANPTRAEVEAFMAERAK
jgi:fructokinase